MTGSVLTYGTSETGHRPVSTTGSDTGHRPAFPTGSETGHSPVSTTAAYVITGTALKPALGALGRRLVFGRGGGRLGPGGLLVFQGARGRLLDNARWVGQA